MSALKRMEEANALRVKALRNSLVFDALEAFTIETLGVIKTDSNLQHEKAASLFPALVKRIEEIYAETNDEA